MLLYQTHSETLCGMLLLRHSMKLTGNTFVTYCCVWVSEWGGESIQLFLHSLWHSWLLEHRVVLMQSPLNIVCFYLNISWLYFPVLAIHILNIFSRFLTRVLMPVLWYSYVMCQCREDFFPCLNSTIVHAFCFLKVANITRLELR